MSRTDPAALFPRILVIDDLFGWSVERRRDLCAQLRLLDCTGDDDAAERPDAPVAEAAFSPGQRLVGDARKNDVQVALSAVGQGWPSASSEHWGLVLLDLRFVSGPLGADGEPEGQPGDSEFGLSILRALLAEWSDLPVVILSAAERATVIEECRRAGALGFLQRVGTRGASPPHEELQDQLRDNGLIPDLRLLSDERLRLVGCSLPHLTILRQARRAATGAGNILLQGETGTGKELLARYIHDLSPNRAGPYQVFYPFATAPSLQEDELFGHTKGAYTGALVARAGLFERANGGTLFVDEFGDISPELQGKLLRPLESRVVSRQGGDQDVPLRLQVVLATNKDLDRASREGGFRADLLNRVNAFRLNVPPLRTRPEDIPALTDHLARFCCLEHRARWPRKIDTRVYETLARDTWPDNVRGLRNTIERAVKNTRDSELLLPSDVDIHGSVDQPGSDIEAPSSHRAADRVGDLLQHVEQFRFPPDYEALVGQYPRIQRAVATFLARYLRAAVEATVARRPRGPTVNLAGAGSCMLGEAATTNQAADMVKRLLQMDAQLLDTLLAEDELLANAFERALRVRPKQVSDA